ncbi:MAG: acyl-CoA synthetase [Steroidobacteraceae bacterium]|nr:acyl-CoA synthetase [Steroidobacteraceae bacterium]
MPGSNGLIATRADVARIERTPLAEQYAVASTYDLLRQAAAEHGPREALVFVPQGSADEPPFVYSYDALFRRVTQAANVFHRLGVGPRDVVAYVLPSVPQTHFTLWGGEAAGIACAINPLLEPSHIVEILRAAGAKVLVTVGPGPGGDLWDRMAKVVEQVPTLETVLQVSLAQYLVPGHVARPPAVATIAGRRVLDFDLECEREPGDQLVSGRVIRPTDIASYFHTGGTTGTPKIAQHTHANEVFLSWDLREFLGLAPGAVFLCGLPLFHVNGAIGTGPGTWCSGATVLLAGLQGYRTPKLIAGFWRLIERYRVNYFSAVPTVYAALLEVPLAGADVSSLRYAICGAAPMPPEVFRRFETVTGLRILEGYGLTEATCASCLNPPAGERRIGSVGLAMPYQRVKAAIVGADGRHVRDCEPDEIGVLLVSGPAVFPGYLREQDNAKLWAEEGWLNTGDLCRIDRDGYAWLTGRAKDLIIRGGHNIDPQLIEEVLATHPSVAMAAAVGQPDAYAGELPMAFVAARPGTAPSSEELVAYCRERIPERAAVPVRVVVLPSLPATAVGKIFKPELRWRAIEHVLTAALAQQSIAASVTAGADQRRGTLARVQLADPARADEARQLLGAFAVACEVS